MIEYAKSSFQVHIFILEAESFTISYTETSSPWQGVLKFPAFPPCAPVLTDNGK